MIHIEIFTILTRYTLAGGGFPSPGVPKGALTLKYV